MLKWAIIFAIISLVAGVFGFTHQLCRIRSQRHTFAAVEDHDRSRCSGKAQRCQACGNTSVQRHPLHHLRP